MPRSGFAIGTQGVKQIVENEGTVYVAMEKGPDLIFVAGGYGICAGKAMFPEEEARKDLGKVTRTRKKKEDPGE